MLAHRGLFFKDQIEGLGGLLVIGLRGDEEESFQHSIRTEPYVGDKAARLPQTLQGLRDLLRRRISLCRRL